MTIEDIRTFCLSLNGVTEDIKWENHLCFSVGGKMFTVTAPDNWPVSASFKTSDELFEELTDREGLIPAPYMARNKWVFTDNINRIDPQEWRKLLTIAYEQVLARLPGKLQRQLSGEDVAPKAARPAPKKEVTKKAPPKKITSKKAAAKKAPAKKAPTKKAAPKK